MLKPSIAGSVIGNVSNQALFKMMRNTALRIMLMLGVVAAVQAQDDPAIDSLHKLLDVNSDNRHLIFHELGIAYADIDNELSLEYLLKAETAAGDLADSAFFVKNRLVQGQILRRLGRFDEVLSRMGEVISEPGFARYKNEIPYIFQTIGLTHLYRSEFSKALEHLLEALERAEALQDTFLLRSATANVGIVYYRLSDFRRAASFLRRSYEMRKEDRDVSCDILINLALCYLHDGRLQDARHYVEQVQKCAGDQPMFTQVHAVYVDGLYHFKASALDAAEDRFLAALDLAKQSEHHRMELDILFVLGEVREQAGDVAGARIYLEKGARLIKRGVAFNREQLRFYKKLGDFADEAGDYQQAAAYRQKYIELRDSIYTDELTTALMKAEADFVSRRHVKELELQQALILSNEEALRQKELTNIVLAVLAAFIAFFLVMVYRDLRRSRAIKKTLTRLVHERTGELQAQHLAAAATLREHYARAEWVRRDLLCIAKRIFGLCLVARREAEATPSEVCFKEIEVHAGGIEEAAGRLGELMAASDASNGMRRDQEV